MSVLPNDYDSDPGRFLSAGQPSRDDVHPYVADRFAKAGARTVLDAGGGNGRLARLLPVLGMRCLLIDLSPTMLDLAPSPSVRADGARLPVADESVDAVAQLYTLYHYADPLIAIGEARRVLKPGGLFAACAPNRDSHPELASIVPDWGADSTFDGEDAAAIVAEIFDASGDTVEEDRWDGTQIPLNSLTEAAARLRIYGLTEAESAAKAATLNLPLTLTARGCVVYATKNRLSRTNRDFAWSLARCRVRGGSRTMEQWMGNSAPRCWPAATKISGSARPPWTQAIRRQDVCPATSGPNGTASTPPTPSG